MIDADADGDADGLRTARAVLRVRPRLPIATSIDCEYVCSADDGRVLSGKGCVAPPRPRLRWSAHISAGAVYPTSALGLAGALLSRD